MKEKSTNSKNWPIPSGPIGTKITCSKEKFMDECLKIEQYIAPILKILNKNNLR